MYSTPEIILLSKSFQSLNQSTSLQIHVTEEISLWDAYRTNAGIGDGTKHILGSETRP